MAQNTQNQVMVYNYRVSGEGKGNRTSIYLIVLLALAVLIRVLYLVVYLHTSPYANAPIVDSNYYFQWAIRVAKGKGYGPMPYYMSPLYPEFLGILFKFFGISTKLPIYLQAISGVLNVYLIYLIGKRVFNEATGIIAGFIVLFYAPVIFVESKILTETFAITASLISIILIIDAHKQPSYPRYIISGILTGIATGIRPNILIFAILCFLCILIQGINKKDKKGIIYSIIFITGVIISIVPITLRNIIVGHDFVPISSNGGIVFAQANHPEATGIATKLPHFSGRIQDQQREEMRIASRFLHHKVTPSQSSAFWFKTAMNYIINHPMDFLLLEAKKVLWSLHSIEARDVYNIYMEKQYNPVLRLLFLPFYLIAGTAISGFILALKQRKDRISICITGCYVISIYLTLWIFAVSFRYRLPAVVIMAIFSGYGILQLINAIKHKNFQTLSGGITAILLMYAISLVPYPIKKITAEAPTNMAVAWLRQNRPDRALPLLKKAINMNPDFTNAHFTLALTYLRLNKLKAAKQQLIKTLQLDPEHAQAYHNLAMIYDHFNQIKKAIPLYKKAIKYAPTRPQPHCNLAIDLYLTGQYNRAQKETIMCERLGGHLSVRFHNALNRAIKKNAH